jgi:hypothetical protein
VQGSGVRNPVLCPPRAGATGTWRAGNLLPRSEHAMKDLIYIAVSIAFFVVGWAYARACDRL